MSEDAKKLSKVRKWIRSGELSTTNKVIESVIEECGRRLDHHCSHDILGEVLFLGNDGQYYTITVEAVLSRASKEYVKDILAEDQ